MCPSEEIRCRQQVANIGRKVTVGEVAITVTKPCEVEAKYGNRLLSQLPCDLRRGLQVLTASKAMCEQRIRDRFVRKLKESGQWFTLSVLERNLLLYHRRGLLVAASRLAETTPVAGE